MVPAPLRLPRLIRVEAAPPVSSLVLTMKLLALLLSVVVVVADSVTVPSICSVVVAARGELQGAAGDGVADQLDGAAVVGHDLAGGGVEVGDVAVDLEDAAALGLQRGA